MAQTGPLGNTGAHVSNPEDAAVLEALAVGRHKSAFGGSISPSTYNSAHPAKQNLENDGDFKALPSDRATEADLVAATRAELTEELEAGRYPEDWSEEQIEEHRRRTGPPPGWPLNRQEVIDQRPLAPSTPPEPASMPTYKTTISPPEQSSTGVARADMEDLSIDEFQAALYEKFREMIVLLTAKRKAYGTANIVRYGQFTSIINAGNKVDRLYNMAKDGASASADGDTVIDAWQDLIGYGVLGLLIAEDELRRKSQLSSGGQS